MSPTTVSVLDTNHSHAMLHKEGEIFPGLRSRTAHMESHKAIWAMKQRSLRTSYHPTSRLRSSLSHLGTFSPFLSQPNLDIYRSQFLPLFTLSRLQALSIPPFHPSTPVTSTRPAPRPKEAILGPETVLGPNFPYLLLLLLLSHPLLLAMQRQHIPSNHPANTKKLVHAELSSAVRPSHSIESENSCLTLHHRATKSNKKLNYFNTLATELGVHQYLQFSY